MPIKKIIAAALCVLLFVGNSVLCHASETNFWKQRQHAIQLAAAVPMPDRQIQTPFFSTLDSSLQNNLLPLKKIDIDEERKRVPVPDSFKTLIEHLPYNMGSVRGVSHPASGPSNKVVILLQDVHMNHEAQQNISAVVTTLSEHKLLDFVALEGTPATINLDSYRQSCDRDVMGSVADFLLATDKISGAIHGALTMSATPPQLQGVDDPVLYGENVNAYLNAVPFAARNQRSLHDQERLLLKRVQRPDNMTLASFVTLTRRYQQQQISIGAYLQALSRYGSLSASLNNFLRAIDLENIIDYKKVETERAALLGALSTTLTHDETATLFQKGLAYRLSSISASQFYDHVRGLTQRKGIALARYPELQKYIDYVLAADGMDGEDIFLDIHRQEELTGQRLTRTPEEKIFLEQLKLNGYLQKILVFALTAAEWEDYQRLKQTIVVPPLEKLEAFEAFYETAKKRDGAMTERVKSLFSRDGAMTGLLVVGGFHAQGMIPKLNQAGYTTISFVPKISKISSADGSAYLSVFAQDKTPLEKLVMGEKLFLARDPAFGLPLLSFPEKAVELWMKNHKPEERVVSYSSDSLRHPRAVAAIFEMRSRSEDSERKRVPIIVPSPWETSKPYWSFWALLLRLKNLIKNKFVFERKEIRANPRRALRACFVAASLFFVIWLSSARPAYSQTTPFNETEARETWTSVFSVHHGYTADQKQAAIAVLSVELKILSTEKDLHQTVDALQQKIQTLTQQLKTLDTTSLQQQIHEIEQHPYSVPDQLLPVEDNMVKAQLAAWRNSDREDLRNLANRKDLLALGYDAQSKLVAVINDVGQITSRQALSSEHLLPIQKSLPPSAGMVRFKNEFLVVVPIYKLTNNYKIKMPGLTTELKKIEQQQANLRRNIAEIETQLAAARNAMKPDLRTASESTIEELRQEKLTAIANAEKALGEFKAAEPKTVQTQVEQKLAELRAEDAQRQQAEQTALASPKKVGEQRAPRIEKTRQKITNKLPAKERSGEARLIPTIAAPSPVHHDTPTADSSSFIAILIGSLAFGIAIAGLILRSKWTAVKTNSRNKLMKFLQYEIVEARVLQTGMNAIVPVELIRDANERPIEYLYQDPSGHLTDIKVSYGADGHVATSMTTLDGNLVDSAMLSYNAAGFVSTIQKPAATGVLVYSQPIKVIYNDAAGGETEEDLIIQDPNGIAPTEKLIYLDRAINGLMESASEQAESGLDPAKSLYYAPGTPVELVLAGIPPSEEIDETFNGGINSVGQQTINFAPAETPFFTVPNTYQRDPTFQQYLGFGKSSADPYNKLSGLALMADGSFLEVDKNAHALLMLGPDGSLARTIDLQGLEPTLYGPGQPFLATPEGVAIMSEDPSGQHLQVAVALNGTRELAVFTLDENTQSVSRQDPNVKFYPLTFGPRNMVYDPSTGEFTFLDQQATTDPLASPSYRLISGHIDSQTNSFVQDNVLPLNVTADLLGGLALIPTRPDDVLVLGVRGGTGVAIQVGSSGQEISSLPLPAGAGTDLNAVAVAPNGDIIFAAGTSPNITGEQGNYYLSNGSVPASSAPTLSGILDGVLYTLTQTTNFPFSKPNGLGNYSDIAFSADGKSLWVVDKVAGVAVRFDPNDFAVLQTITFPASLNVDDILPIDDTHLGLILGLTNQLEIFNISSATTQLSTSDVAEWINLKGNVKGIVYVPTEDAFYYVTDGASKSVIKTTIDPVTRKRIHTTTIIPGKKEVVKLTIDLNTGRISSYLDVFDLPTSQTYSDLTYSQLFPNDLFLTAKVDGQWEEEDLDITDGTAVIRDDLLLGVANATGVAFGPDATLYAVNRGAGGDVSVFHPDHLPVPLSSAGPTTVVQRSSKVKGNGGGHNGSHNRVDNTFFDLYRKAIKAAFGFYYNLTRNGGIDSAFHHWLSPTNFFTVLNSVFSKAFKMKSIGGRTSARQSNPHRGAAGILQTTNITSPVFPGPDNNPAAAEAIPGELDEKPELPSEPNEMGPAAQAPELEAKPTPEDQPAQKIAMVEDDEATPAGMTEDASVQPQLASAQQITKKYDLTWLHYLLGVMLGLVTRYFVGYKPKKNDPDRSPQLDDNGPRAPPPSDAEPTTPAAVTEIATPAANVGTEIVDVPAHVESVTTLESPASQTRAKKSVRKSPWGRRFLMMIVFLVGSSPLLMSSSSWIRSLDASLPKNIPVAAASVQQSEDQTRQANAEIKHDLVASVKQAHEKEIQKAENVVADLDRQIADTKTRFIQARNVEMKQQQVSQLAREVGTLETIVAEAKQAAQHEREQKISLPEKFHRQSAEHAAIQKFLQERVGPFDVPSVGALLRANGQFANYFLSLKQFAENKNATDFSVNGQNYEIVRITELDKQMLRIPVDQRDSVIGMLQHDGHYDYRLLPEHLEYIEFHGNQLVYKTMLPGADSRVFVYLCEFDQQRQAIISAEFASRANRINEAVARVKAAEASLEKAKTIQLTAQPELNRLRAVSPTQSAAGLAFKSARLSVVKDNADIEARTSARPKHRRNRFSPPFKKLSNCFSKVCSTSKFKKQRWFLTIRTIWNP